MSEFITLVEREETPLWVVLAIQGFSDRDAFERATDVDFQLEKYRFTGRFHEIGLLDLERLSGVIESKFASEGEKYFDWYEETCRQSCSALYNTAFELAKLPPAKANNEIGTRLARYFAATHQCMPFLLSIFPVQGLLSKELGQAIEPLVTQTDLSIDTALALLSAPNTPTAVELDSQGLAEIAQDVRLNTQLSEAIVDPGRSARLAMEYPEFYARLEEHCKNYGWLRTFTFRNRPYTIDDLLLRLRDRVWRLDRVPDLHTVSSTPEKDEMNQVRSIEAQLDQHGASLLQLARKYATLRFFRVDVHFMSAAKIVTLLDETAARLNIGFELLPYLTDREILTGISGSTDDLSNLATLRKTMGFDVQLQDDKSIAVTSPSVPKPVSVERQGLLEGVSACLGSWSGRVRIVRTSADCADFDRGDILVSPMTTPEFMSAIERAGAIVTDEGGVLCHAAIISRELNIPCVIGTGMASHVLRAGEMISVTAQSDKGIVTREDF